VISCQGGHHPPPIEGVVAGAVQQHQWRAFARAQVSDTQLADFDVLLLNGHVSLTVDYLGSLLS
jgi:hypothetical protein